ncbi:MAG TPA: hypothetical protein VIF62_05005, partial [Labilithrix sp.]
MADSSTQLRAGRASVANAQIEARLAALSATDDPHERAEILTEIALAFRDDLGDRGQAIDALLEAWQADPRHEPILEHLEPLLHSEGRWAEILESTRVAATSDPDRERSMVYAEAMVRWLTLHVPQPELARQWIERIRAIDSTHAVVHLLQAAVSREHGDLKRELAELDLAVLSSRRADDRARIHLLMAARYGDERTKNRAEAKKHFEAAHKLFPRTMEPLRGLELVAVADNDKVGLADVLRKQAEADVSNDEKVAILLRLARLEEEEFRKPDLAAKTFEQVVTLAADANEALDGLERCYRASRAWPELARVLELGAAEATDPTVRATRLKSLGDVLESKLGDIRAAIATYERLGGILGDDETILSELARLAEKSGEIPLAVKCREKLAVLMREPAQSARMYVIAGQLLAPIDPAAARREFERAIAVDRTCQAAYNALLWDARAASDDARAERYLEERARAVESPRARATAFVELAEHRAKRGDGEGARRAYESAAEADASNEAAANALAEVFVQEGRYAQADRLVDVAISSAERDKDTERLFALLRAKAAA